MKQNDWTTISKWILGSAAAAAIVCLGMCMFIGALISGEILEIRPGKLLCLIAEVAAVTTACWMSACHTPKSKLPVSLGAAGIFWMLSMIAHSLLCPAGSMVLDWRMAVPILCATAAGFLASRRKTRRR